MKKMREEFTMFKNDQNEWFVAQNKDKSLVEVKLAVKKPNHEQQRNANFEYSKFVNQYLAAGIMPQLKMMDIIKKKGIWDDEREALEKQYIKEITEVRKKLKKGGIKQSEALKLAKEGIDLNFKLINLSSQKNAMLNDSAETLSQNHKFNYLVSECTVYSDSDKRVFKDYEDFQKQDNLEDTRLLTWKSGEVFARLIYNMDEDFRKDWPEYKFLEKYKFVNDKLQFLDKDKNIVDFEGKPIVEEEELDEELEPVFLEG